MNRAAGAESAPDSKETGASDPTSNQASGHASGQASGQAGGNARDRATRPPDPFIPNIKKHLTAVVDPKITYAGSPVQAESLDNDTFRNRVIHFVRNVSAGGEQVSCDVRLALPVGAGAGTASAASKEADGSQVRVLTWLFLDGSIIGRGLVVESDLCVALKEATRQAIASTGNASDKVKKARFVVELPDYDYSMVEHGERGVELSHGLVPVRTFDKKLLAQRIDAGKAYLRRVINVEQNGVHKYYRAPTDSFENKLHSIYTASTLFTLIKLYQYDGDKSLLPDIERATEFLLSMQSRDERERSYGGFFYSYDLDRQRPSRKLVVGTTSKTIFTLIELHGLTKDPKKKERYMEAANLAASWLMSMQRPDGSVRSYLRKTSSGRWKFARKESMLYTGQVLSALSRMHRATGKPMYREAAQQTANYIAGTISQQGCYLGDDYRQPNPISSSWAILSLFDFVRATDDGMMKDLVFTCATELLGRQIRNSKDVYRHGRWQRSLSSSGNGWLAEVMSELYMYCRQNKMGGCDNFKTAITRVLRLLMQYTYTPESAFVVKNPETAHGGVFWNVAERYVRTDSVCHAMNAYVYMMPYLDDGTLIELPEPPLAERLSAERLAKIAARRPSRASSGAEVPVVPGVQVAVPDDEPDAPDAESDEADQAETLVEESSEETASDSR